MPQIWLLREGFHHNDDFDVDDNNGGNDDDDDDTCWLLTPLSCILLSIINVVDEFNKCVGDLSNVVDSLLTNFIWLSLSLLLLDSYGIDSVVVVVVVINEGDDSVFKNFVVVVVGVDEGLK